MRPYPFHLPGQQTARWKEGLCFCLSAGNPHTFLSRTVEWKWPLKLILGDEASQSLARFQCNVQSPKEGKGHSFWDGAPLWTLGPGPANGGQNSTDGLFTLSHSLFPLPARPSCPALGSGQLLPCLKPMTPTNWIIIIYLPARLSCSQSLRNQPASLPAPRFSQPEAILQYRKCTFLQGLCPQAGQQQLMLTAKVSFPLCPAEPRSRDILLF